MRPSFICLPRPVLLEPPIKHRGDLADAGLDIMEFCVLGALANAARSILVKHRHEHALEAGRRAIEDHRSKPLQHLDRTDAREQFEEWGSAGYQQGLTEFNASPPAGYITQEVSRRQLFETAGLSRQDKNLRRLPAVLNRLKRPIGVFPPLILRWGHLPNKMLRFEIDGFWVPASWSKRLPWPPPKRGATVLSLFMFACAVKVDSDISISVERLYERLGSRARWQSEVQRDLSAALVALNSYWAKLEPGLLKALNLSPHGFVLVSDGERVFLRAADDASGPNSEYDPDEEHDGQDGQTEANSDTDEDEVITSEGEQFTSEREQYHAERDGRDAERARWDDMLAKLKAAQ